MAVSAQLRAVGAGFLRARPVITLPAIAANFALFAHSGAPRTQLGALAVGALALQGMFWSERWRLRRRAVSLAGLQRSLWLTALGLGVACAITGRLDSPLVPLLLAPVGIGFAGFGRSRATHGLLAMLLATAAVLAALPAADALPILPAPHHGWAVAVSTVAAALLLWVGVAALVDAHAGAARALARAGDDAAWAAAARARHLAELGAQVAHEVKNPLAAIRGLVEVMREAQVDDERARRRLDVVAEEVARIERILRDYLSGQRPVLALERGPVSPRELRELIEDLVVVLEVRAARAGVELHLGDAAPQAPWRAIRDARAGVELRLGDAAPHASWRAVLDARRIKEALLNLVLNAIDAAHRPEGDGHVAIRWTLAPATVVIEVIDDGPALSEAAYARLGAPGHTTKPDGTGLGVSLARAVAEDHGGALTYRRADEGADALMTARGRGTIATMTLPLELSPPAPEAP